MGIRSPLIYENQHTYQQLYFTLYENARLIRDFNYKKKSFPKPSYQHHITNIHYIFYITLYNVYKYFFWGTKPRVFCTKHPLQCTRRQKIRFYQKSSETASLNHSNYPLQNCKCFMK